MKLILFGFDGLRPDCVTMESMPRLFAFLNENASCTNNRAVFPTETYVNHPSIFTGFLPDRHGLIANAYFDTAVSRQDFFVGSRIDRIESAEKQTRGHLFKVPSLSETMVKKGYSFLSISSNSPGSTRLIAHKAGSIGGINLSVRGLEHAYPKILREKYRASLDGMTWDTPDLNGLKKINEIVHDIFRNEGIPDVNIIWYGEPDHSFHEHGIGSKQSLLALKTADTCFGEILDEYWKNDVQIIVASDHGHITVKKHFDLVEALENSGFRHGETLSDPLADFTLLWGYSGNIYVHKPGLLPDIISALQQMPEIGMLFTQDRDGVNGIIPGTFSSRLVGGDHHRAGDIRFVLRHFNEKDDNGYEGTCICAAPISIGCGIHGGLHPSEIHTVLGFGGTAFKQNSPIASLTGVIDITPTIYKLFGINPSVLPQGRILSEVFRNKTLAPVTVEKRNYTCGTGAYRQMLELDYVNAIPYFTRGEGPV